MWFSTHQEATTQLSINQLDLLNKYKSIDPFIRLLFFDNATNLVDSHSLYMVSNNSDSMYFEYPSMYSSTCSDLSSEVMDTYYNESQQAYEQSNGSFVSVPFVERSSAKNVTLLVLCSPARYFQFSVVSCVKINQRILVGILQRQNYSNFGIHY